MTFSEETDIVHQKTSEADLNHHFELIPDLFLNLLTET